MFGRRIQALATGRGQVHVFGRRQLTKHASLAEKWTSPRPSGELLHHELYCPGHGSILEDVRPQRRVQVRVFGHRLLAKYTLQAEKRTSPRLSRERSPIPLPEVQLTCSDRCCL